MHAGRLSFRRRRGRGFIAHGWQRTTNPPRLLCPTSGAWHRRIAWGYMQSSAQPRWTAALALLEVSNTGLEGAAREGGVAGKGKQGGELRGLGSE